MATTLSNSLQTLSLQTLSLQGAVAKYEEAARVCDEPAAGWGPRNAFSFASAPAGAAKHGVSASVILG